MLMSRGFPWVVYNQAADTWWNPACDGLIDKNDKPKQILAALETVISYFSNGKFGGLLGITMLASSTLTQIM